MIKLFSNLGTYIPRNKIKRKEDMSASGMTYLTLFFSFFCFIVSTYGPFFQLFHFWAIFLVKFVENVIQSGVRVRYLGLLYDRAPESV